MPDDPLPAPDHRTEPVARKPKPTDTAPLPVVGPAPSYPPPLYPPPLNTPPVGPPPPAGPPIAVGQWGVPPGMPPRRRSFGLALKVLGLVAVAVVAGVIWVALQPPPQRGKPIASPSAAASQYVFTQQPPRETSTDCVAHSYTQVQAFFKGTPCVELRRSLFTTTTTDGKKVVVSVAVVRMADAAQAAALRKLADTDGTGNVNNLITEKQTFPGGPTELGDSGYISEQNGLSVTIVETGFFDSPKRNPDLLLKTIAADALRLGR